MINIGNGEKKRGGSKPPPLLSPKPLRKQTGGVFAPPKDVTMLNDNNDIAQPPFAGCTYTLNEAVAAYCQSTEAAVVYDLVSKHLKHNKIMNINRRDGRTWLSNAPEIICGHLPMTKSKATRLLRLLFVKGYLITKEYPTGAWYALPTEVNP